MARKGFTSVDELRGMLSAAPAATRPNASVPVTSSQCARPTAARRFVVMTDTQTTAPPGPLAPDELERLNA